MNDYYNFSVKKKKKEKRHFSPLIRCWLTEWLITYGYPILCGTSSGPAFTGRTWSLPFPYTALRDACIHFIFSKIFSSIFLKFSLYFKTLDNRQILAFNIDISTLSTQMKHSDFPQECDVKMLEILSCPDAGPHCTPSYLSCKNTFDIFPYHYIPREQTFARDVQALSSEPALSSAPGAQ